MFERNNLAKQVDHLVAIVRAEASAVEAAQKAANRVLTATKGSSIQQLDDAASKLAALVPDLRITRAALLAVTGGALVERGASMEPLAQPVLARFSEAVQGAIPFVEACRAAAAGSQSDAEESSDLDAEEAVTRFGERVGERVPDAARAFGSLDFLSTAALAMLSRSKALRKQLRADSTLVQAIARLDTLGIELRCFHEMLTMLDDEQIVVLHPAPARGYLIRIAGIADNFQLHTLLADALIGDTEQGWLPGEHPAPEIAALAKDAPIANPRKLPTAYGAFNLWNWTALGADGMLPEGQTASSEHWIWNEGLPADIVPFHGTRVILIGPPPYARSWNSGRFFPAMVGELEVLRQLTADEARDWLDRLARTPKPVLVGHNITEDDVEDIQF